VSDDQILGEVGNGWGVAMSTAGSERGMSLRSPARYTVAAGKLVSLYKQCAKTDPARAAQTAGKVARAWTAAEAYRLHTYWTATRMSAGEPAGAVSSVGKIHWSETDLAIQSAALELLGPDAWNFGRDGRPGAWLDGFLFALAGPIYAGTNEIQRNVVAERLLGMPRG
jgi:alkylation response protein AidB-like acyl-CoA dehydrogenase